MKIGIIGCGHMGSNIAKKLSAELSLYDRNKDKVAALSAWGAPCSEIQQAVTGQDLIVLAIKPQNLKEIVDTFTLKPGQTLVSLLAGVTLASLKHYFPHANIIRMMPNLPLIYGEGVIGLSGDAPNDELTQIFSPLGTIFWFDESKMDGLTALAGSGPAFFFSMIEAMIDAGIAMGFTAKESTQIVYQMLQGSLSLLSQTKQLPAALKYQIASPAGTTIAGLKHLEEHALRGIIINTFLAARKRAEELSK